MVPHPQPWIDAWVDSAYGADGFWRTSCPHEHFRTASATGDQLAVAIAALVPAHIVAVVDIGAGGGELLAALAVERPELRLAGVDLRPRPADLPVGIDWAVDLWDARYDTWTSGAAPRLLTAAGPTLVIADEWLDDLPCPVVQAGTGGWHEVVVDPSGAEQSGGQLVGELRAWADTWWPRGARAEIGLPRDRAWAQLLAAVRPGGGSALMIDYGHDRDHRPEHGTLTGYRDGRQVPPLPDGTRNLTAHVAVDAVRAAGESAGAATVTYGRQVDVLAPLLDQPLLGQPLLGQTPLDTTPHPDPLTDPVHRSQRSALSSDSAWGSYWWLLQTFRPPPGHASTAPPGHADTAPGNAGQPALPGQPGAAACGSFVQPG